MIESISLNQLEPKRRMFAIGEALIAAARLRVIERRICSGEYFSPS